MDNEIVDGRAPGDPLALSPYEWPDCCDARLPVGVRDAHGWIVAGEFDDADAPREAP